MRTLGIDSSALTATCAVVEDGKILALASVNSGHTHSQTLMPLIESVLRAAFLAPKDIDLFAVSTSPGSFTGLRIGVSTVKGLAFALNKPCAAVSSLEELAYNLQMHDCLVCAAMDARRNQVYNALFRNNFDGEVARICGDRAISAAELVDELTEKYAEENIIFVGDGAEIVAAAAVGKLKNARLAPPQLRLQSGVSVCFAAEHCPQISAKELMPGYLRMPQAERERLEKIEQK